MERSFQEAVKNFGSRPDKGLGHIEETGPIDDSGPSGFWTFCAGAIGILLGCKTYWIISTSHPECPWFMSLLASLFVGLLSYNILKMGWFRRVVTGLFWMVIVLAVIVLGYYFINYLINSHHSA
jgi:hypothetical protein